MKLTVHNPAGAFETDTAHAPRLPDLNGKTICELSNDLWRDYAVFPRIRGLLAKRYPNAKFIPYDQSPKGSYKIDVPEIGRIMKEKGCDAVIGGMAG